MTTLQEVLNHHAPILSSYLDTPVRGQVLEVFADAYGVHDVHDIMELHDAILDNPYKLANIDLEHRKVVEDELNYQLTKNEPWDLQGLTVTFVIIVLIGFLIYCMTKAFIG